MATATATKKRAAATKGPRTPRRTPQYDLWIANVRKTLGNMRNLAVTLYQQLEAGERAQIWKGGPYRNFTECILREFGISAQRWMNFKQVVKRFGTAQVQALGYEACATLLRIPEDQPAVEAKVFAKINEMTAKRGGRPPSAEAIADVAQKIVAEEVGPLQPSPVQPNKTPMQLLREENATLRAQVAELQAKLEACGCT